jgi:hypothetical protein
MEYSGPRVSRVEFYARQNSGRAMSITTIQAQIGLNTFNLSRIAVQIGFMSPAIISGLGFGNKPHGFRSQ